jgi:hypothetical protein
LDSRNFDARGRLFERNITSGSISDSGLLNSPTSKESKPKTIRRSKSPLSLNPAVHSDGSTFSMASENAVLAPKAGYEEDDEGEESDVAGSISGGINTFSNVDNTMLQQDLLVRGSKMEETTPSLKRGMSIKRRRRPLQKGTEPLKDSPVKGSNSNQLMQTSSYKFSEKVRPLMRSITAPIAAAIDETLTGSSTKRSPKTNAKLAVSAFLAKRRVSFEKEATPTKLKTTRPPRPPVYCNCADHGKSALLDRVIPMSMLKLSGLLFGFSESKENPAS